MDYSNNSDLNNAINIKDNNDEVGFVAPCKNRSCPFFTFTNKSHCRHGDNTCLILICYQPEIIEDWLFELTEWAKNVELDKQSPEKQIVKLIEELGELANAMYRSDVDEMIDAIGDIIGALNTFCLQNNINLAECIYKSCLEVSKRNGEIRNGSFIKEEELNKK